MDGRGTIPHRIERRRTRRFLPRTRYGRRHPGREPQEDLRAPSLRRNELGKERAWASPSPTASSRCTVAISKSNPTPIPRSDQPVPPSPSSCHDSANPPQEQRTTQQLSAPRRNSPCSDSLSRIRQPRPGTARTLSPIKTRPSTRRCTSHIPRTAALRSGRRFRSARVSTFPSPAPPARQSTMDRRSPRWPSCRKTSP